MNVQSINFLSHLKNCSVLNKERINWKYSNLVLNIARKLYEEGFVQSYRVVPDLTAPGLIKKKIEVDLRYYQDKPIFRKLKFLSKPSETRYMRYDQLAQINTKKDVVFVSTSKGLMTIDECKRHRVGGTMFFVC